jgi:hypothetical protein
VPYGFLAYAIKGFFENGGRTCFVVRIAGYTAVKAAFVLKNGAGTEIIRISAANEGRWGNKIAIILTQVRHDPNDPRFSLLVTRDRLERESFPNLSIMPDNKRYFVRVINEGDEQTAPSQWVKVEDLIPSATPRTVDHLPDPERSRLQDRIGFLHGGQDGIAALAVKDFLGDADPLAMDKRGLAALGCVDAVGIVCIPDIHIQRVIVVEPPPAEPPRDPCLHTLPEAPPGNSDIFEQPRTFSGSEVFEVQRAMIEHCELQKDRVAILDAPVRPRSGESFTLAEVQEWRSRFDSERGFGAFYYPWIKVVDPLRIGGKSTRAIPPCGHVAGLYARSDFDIGVHKAPANGELFWAEDVTVEVNDAEQGVLNPEGINCIRAFPGRGIRVYGARTVSSNPDWRFVNVRRLMLMIEEAVDEATQWAVFEPHDFTLRQMLVLSISSFLETLWRQGALVGATPAEAFYVKCDDTTNPPEVVAQGKIITEVGVAPTKPVEFIVFRVGRTVEELEIVER